MRCNPAGLFLKGSRSNGHSPERGAVQRTCSPWWQRRRGGGRVSGEMTAVACACPADIHGAVVVVSVLDQRDIQSITHVRSVVEHLELRNEGVQRSGHLAPSWPLAPSASDWCALARTASSSRRDEGVGHLLDHMQGGPQLRWGVVPRLRRGETGVVRLPPARGR